ncbi:hypothetical protein LR48_Vigan07g241900 [Vigna angularis]|uniref:Uncharacterized protein n=1 Tax=Phaseolus angularis TaxID=3914 RepID=A0A0L9V0R1_PHAAN|nr:hypothetical protein LR48_Vigan07g241900 [Vigna angularis]
MELRLEQEGVRPPLPARQFSLLRFVGFSSVRPVHAPSPSVCPSSTSKLVCFNRVLTDSVETFGAHRGAEGFQIPSGDHERCEHLAPILSRPTSSIDIRRPSIWPSRPASDKVGVRRPAIWPPRYVILPPGHFGLRYSAKFGIQDVVIRPQLSAVSTPLPEVENESRPSWIKGRSPQRALDRPASSSVRPHEPNVWTFSLRINRSPFGLSILQKHVRPRTFRRSSKITRTFAQNRPAIGPPGLYWISTIRPFGLRYVAKFGMQHAIVRPGTFGRSSKVTRTSVPDRPPNRHPDTGPSGLYHPSFVASRVQAPNERSLGSAFGTILLIQVSSVDRFTLQDQVGEKERSTENDSQLGWAPNEEASAPLRPSWKKSVPPRTTLNLVGLRTKRRPPHKDQIGEKECSTENDSQLGWAPNAEPSGINRLGHQASTLGRPPSTVIVQVLSQIWHYTFNRPASWPLRPSGINRDRSGRPASTVIVQVLSQIWHYTFNRPASTVIVQVLSQIWHSTFNRPASWPLRPSGINRDRSGRPASTVIVQVLSQIWHYTFNRPASTVIVQVLSQIWHSTFNRPASWPLRPSGINRDRSGPPGIGQAPNHSVSERPPKMARPSKMASVQNGNQDERPAIQDEASAQNGNQETKRPPKDGRPPKMESGPNVKHQDRTSKKNGCPSFHGSSGPPNIFDVRPRWKVRPRIWTKCPTSGQSFRKRTSAQGCHVRPIIWTERPDVQNRTPTQSRTSARDWTSAQGGTSAQESGPNVHRAANHLGSGRPPKVGTTSARDWTSAQGGTSAQESGPNVHRAANHLGSGRPPKEGVRPARSIELRLEQEGVRPPLPARQFSLLRFVGFSSVRPVHAPSLSVRPSSTSKLVCFNRVLTDSVETDTVLYQQ